MGVTRANSAFKRSQVQVAGHGFHFLAGEFHIGRAAPHHRDHLLHFPVAHEVMGNIHHDIPRADHCNTLTKQVFFLAERRQKIIVEDNILGMVNAGQVLPGQAQPLGALGAGGDKNGLETGFEQVFQDDIPAATDGHVSKVINRGQVQDLLELGAQTLFHFELIRVNAILSQAAGFDITVEQHHMCPAFGQFSGRVQARRSGPDDGYHVLRVFHPNSPLPVMRIEL